MQLEFDIFPYLVHKFIMKNTAALSCSNIVLQKKTVLFKVTHYAQTLQGTKWLGREWKRELSADKKKINTIKLNSIPWK